MDFGVIVIAVGILFLGIYACVRLKRKQSKKPIDLIPNGWEIVEDVEPSKFQVKDLEMVSFLENGEEYVKGDVLRQRAVGLKANLGLADAKYILDHQAEIPPEFRTKYLVFSGTLLRAPDGCLGVAFLYWDGERWYHDFRWVGDDFDVSDRLVRSK